MVEKVVTDSWSGTYHLSDNLGTRSDVGKTLCGEYIDLHDSYGSSHHRFGERTDDITLVECVQCHMAYYHEGSE